MTWDADSQTITRVWQFADQYSAGAVAPRAGFDTALDDIVTSVNSAIADQNSKVAPTYSSRASAEAATVPASAKAIHVQTPTGELLTYVRNTRGTAGIALTTNSGSYEWMPASPWLVFPDHFADNTTQGTTDMKTAIQSAVDYVEDLSGTGTYLSGGRVNFMTANYLTTGQIRVNDHGVHFYGSADDTGSRISNSSGSSNTILFRPDSPTTGETLEGGGVHGITFWNTSSSNPTGGAHVEVDRTARVQINNCSFYNHYVGIKFSGAGQGCTVTCCHITQGSNTSAAVTAGSAGIKIVRRQVNAGVADPAQDSGNSNWYTECNGIDIVSCEINSNNYGMQDGIHIDSCDGVKVIGGHINGQIRSGICLAPAQDNISFSDLAFIGVHVDPLNGTTQDGVVIEDFASAGGSAMRDISFTGCSFSGASRDSMRIVMKCKNITVTGCKFKAAGDHHLTVNSANAQGIIFANNTLFKSDQDASGAVPAIYVAAGNVVKVKDNVIDTGTRGVQFLAAATGVEIEGNTFSNMTEADIVPPDAVDASCVIGRNNVSASQTVASTATIALPPGILSFRITGTNPIATIRASATGSGPVTPNSSWDGRVVTLRATASFAVNTTGNIRLTNGVSFQMSDGDRLTLEYDGTDSLWYEVGRSYGKQVSRDQVTVNNATSDLVADFAIATDEVHEWTIFQRSAAGALQGKWRVSVDDDGTTVTGLVDEVHDVSTEVVITVTDNADGTYTINGQNTAANDKTFVARLDARTEWAN